MTNRLKYLVGKRCYFSVSIWL